MGAARDNTQFQAQLINIIKRLYSVMKTEEFGFDEYQITKFSYGTMVNRADLYTKRQELVWKAIRGEAEKQSNYNYKPFDVLELSSKTLIDIDFLASRKIRSLSRGVSTNENRRMGQSSNDIGKRLTPQVSLSNMNFDSKARGSRVTFK